MNGTIASLRQSGHLRRVDVALADWIARAFSDTSPETPLAAALAARAVADGHSALALEQAQAWIARLAGDGKPSDLPPAPAWREALHHSSAVHAHAAGEPATLTPLVLDAQDRIYLRRYFDYERGLALELVTRAMRYQPESRVPSPESRSTGLDPDQHHAITTALSRRFTLVTGGPGSGKTHVVARILATLAQRAQAQGEPVRVALAAPTGKAAARLGESIRAQVGGLELAEELASQIPLDAQTVHRLIGMSPWQARPRFDRAMPLSADVVVVDEVSMVDLPLMAKLVAAVPDTARLILLGDPGQLAAVEAGNVLGALVEASIDGPLHGCHVALTGSHRFATDSGLGALATAIARGDAAAADTALDSAGDVELLAATRTAQLVAAAADAYQPILSAADPAEALRAAHGFRVLTALRHGSWGCLALDREIGARLQRSAGVRGDQRWWPGRLLLVTANRPELGLFNGDTGVLWPDAEGGLQAWFEAADDTPRAVPAAALPPHEGAFALTVHKAQGSEFERVALVTGPKSAVLTRELLYTGVTRARAHVSLYSDPDTLHVGVANPTLRMTGLADRLREAATAT